jgi:mRNA-degrading endonuclease toxin of MazEF toxin-antitoxin module
MGDKPLDKTTQVLEELKRIVRAMDPERRRKFLEWQEIQNKYLQWEQTFYPKKLRKYSRGEIVYAHFGFNVGAEFGGTHYGVVVEDNEKSAGNVMVIPLSSLKPGQTEADVHRNDVYLGTISDLNSKEAFAIVRQMRPISKLRIQQPKRATDNVFRLSDDQLSKIDRKIGSRLTRLHFE